MKYNDFNDYELLYMVKEESEEAYEVLQKKYEPMIYKKAAEINKTLKGNGIEMQDLLQEGRIGLSKAVKNYNQDKNEFITLAYTCIENQIYLINRVFKTNKNKTLNIAMSNNSIIYNQGIDFDNLAKSNETNEFYIDFEQIKRELTEEEYQILILKIYGYSIGEVAKIMKTTDRHISYKNIIITKKLKKIPK